jgi:hypothetical protein
VWAYARSTLDGGPPGVVDDFCVGRGAQQPLALRRGNLHHLLTSLRNHCAGTHKAGVMASDCAKKNTDAYVRGVPAKHPGYP